MFLYLLPLSSVKMTLLNTNIPYTLLDRFTSHNVYHVFHTLDEYNLSLDLQP